jgi:hypothetical protein
VYARQEVAEKLGLSVRGLGGEHTAICKVRDVAAAAAAARSLKQLLPARALRRYFSRVSLARVMLI